MTRDWTLTDQAAAADDKRHREWWRKPDPFDPRNAPDMPDDGEGGVPSSTTDASQASGTNKTPRPKGGE